MARPLRIDVLNGLFHIGNRALHQRAMFDSEVDARRFIGLLADRCYARKIEVHAHCEMTNHFHLLICSTTGEMSKTLQWIESLFVRKFNRSYGRDGTLLKGRFFSKLVKSEAYLRAVTQYIHDNPVEARIVTSAPEYPFSSLLDYLRTDGPPWLTRTLIEGLVRSATGSTTYDPTTYPAVLGRKWTPAALRWFRRFSEGHGQDDPSLDGVLAARPAHVRRWLEKCAKEADGTVARVPITDAQTVLAVIATCASARPEWQVRQRFQFGSGWRILTVGLLFDLATESFAEIGRLLGIPGRAACSLHCQHRRRFEIDAEYRAIAHSTAVMISATCHGDGS